MEGYTKVGFYTTEFEAKLAESILSEAGVRSFLQSPDVYPPGDLKSGITLYVNPEDSVAARELLTEFETDLEIERAKQNREDT